MDLLKVTLHLLGVLTYKSQLSTKAAPNTIVVQGKVGNWEGVNWEIVLLNGFCGLERLVLPQLYTVSPLVFCYLFLVYRSEVSSDSARN
jgi:hypothetical protein